MQLYLSWFLDPKVIIFYLGKMKHLPFCQVCLCGLGSGAKNMFLNLPRDMFKNTSMTPLRNAHFVIVGKGQIEDGK